LGEHAFFSVDQCAQRAIEDDSEIRRLKGKKDIGGTKTREAIQRFFPTLNMEMRYAPSKPRCCQLQWKGVYYKLFGVD
jgi:hypothetical protein